MVPGEAILVVFLTISLPLRKVCVRFWHTSSTMLTHLIYIFVQHVSNFLFLFIAVHFGMSYKLPVTETSHRKQLSDSFLYIPLEGWLHNDQIKWFIIPLFKIAYSFNSKWWGRRQDGGGVGRGKHFLLHKFIKRAFKRRVNSTNHLLNAGRGHQAPRKATQLLERR